MNYKIGYNDFSKQNYSLKEAMAYIFNPCEHNNHKEYGRFIFCIHHILNRIDACLNLSKCAR